MAGITATTQPTRRRGSNSTRSITADCGIPEPEDCTGWRCPRMGAHPEGAASSRTRAELWSVRRWVSTVEGKVTVSGTLRKQNTGGGNGTDGYIVVDGAPLWTRFLAASDATGFTFSVAVTVHVGSTIHFGVGAHGDDSFDDTRFAASIVQSQPGDILFQEDFSSRHPGVAGRSRTESRRGPFRAGQLRFTVADCFVSRGAYAGRDRWRDYAIDYDVSDVGVDDSVPLLRRDQRIRTVFRYCAVPLVAATCRAVPQRHVDGLFWFEPGVWTDQSRARRGRGSHRSRVRRWAARPGVRGHGAGERRGGLASW